MNSNCSTQEQTKQMERKDSEKNAIATKEITVKENKSIYPRNNIPIVVQNKSPYAK